MAGFRKEQIHLDLYLGTEYEIFNIAKTKSKDDLLYFKGKLIQETEDFYVFKCGHGYCESFLKICFAIKELGIRDATTKKAIKVIFKKLVEEVDSPDEQRQKVQSNPGLIDIRCWHSV